jgi:hypothetical protein
VDGTTFDTTQRSTIDITPNGATQVSLVTNLNTYGCGYMKLVSWQNTDGAAVITNASGYYGIKIDAP